MEGRQVSLTEILDAREQRVLAQQGFLEKYRRPVMCFTMNIPGPVKDTPLIRRGFAEGLRLFEAAVPGCLAKEVRYAHTGATALYAVDMDARKLKEICIRIEESCRLGRLFDMDVLDADGSKPDRGSSRGCMVCGAAGRGCAASRAHSVEVLQAVTQEILREHFLEADANAVAQCAVEALLEEVNATPKPGLVDRRNNGSHRDMDLNMFTASAHCLEGYFRTCFTLGAAQADPFPAMRQAGLEAEQTMFRVTGGVNTHKGAIFTLGILCGSLGALWTAADPLPDADAVLQKGTRLAGPYLAKGAAGARGQVLAGFPHVRLALTHLRSQKEDAHLSTLLQLIAQVEDTNLLRRGGAEGAQWAAREAKKLLPAPTTAQLEALDDAFIAQDLSPGGCADLLAAAIFLDKRTKKA